MVGATREAERRVLRLLHNHTTTKSHLTQIHAHLLRRHLHHSNLLLAHFTAVCGALRRTPYARLVFHQSSNPNILHFNSLIKAYSLTGPFEESLHLFSLMKNAHSIWPDQFTFAPLLKCCSNLSDLKLGSQVHCEVVVAGFESCAGVRIGLVELYCVCEAMGDAKRVFDEMPQRDVVAWNLMIRGYFKRGDVEAGIRLFERMEERSVVSWNSMIAGLAQSGREGEALELLRKMWMEGIELDDATLVVSLPAAARIGDLDIGRWIHCCADETGLSKEKIQVGNAIVDFYCKCGDLVTASKVFDEMPERNVVSWNTMIAGLALNGQGDRCVEFIAEMKRQGLEPNGATFTGALAGVAHAGMVQMGRELFCSMTVDHRIKPKLEHYGCMVDLLGRCGSLQEAYELIIGMPMHPNAAIWGALLSACRIHGDLELAECAAKELISIEPSNSGNYVSLSNIYAELGKWDEVKKVRMMMKETSILKSPGHSFIR
ncbi:hypothetical protein Scep_008893 [Stephania cephalantha]|uniref:Pentatricopeptide repeat-containing protein n=1 Tax=Stephania cephalantha TaxID=152367 RepID=A0AAP0JS94_9MAGN